MPANAHPVEVVAYLGEHAGRTWHLNQDCPGLAGSKRTYEGGRGPNALELVTWLNLEHKTPCRACALNVVLDDLNGAADEDGYHYVACNAEHNDDLRAAAANPCGLCLHLRDYARKAGALAATCWGRVAVLQPGALNARDWAGEPDWSGYPMCLDVVCGRADGLPPMSAAMWDAAAKLVWAGTSLTAALQGVAGLYSEPRHAANKARPGRGDGMPDIGQRPSCDNDDNPNQAAARSQTSRKAGRT